MKTTQKKINDFETLQPFLESMYVEFKDLSSKKPESAVSKGKISIVNRLLRQLKELLAQERSSAYLDLIDEELVPQMSDVTLMLAQYVTAMNQFKSEHTSYSSVKMARDWIT